MDQATILNILARFAQRSINRISTTPGSCYSARTHTAIPTKAAILTSSSSPRVLREGLLQRIDILTEAIYECSNPSKPSR